MSSETKESANVGRGALAIAFAKLYFIFTGLCVQFGLPRLLKWALLGQGIPDASATPMAQALYGDYKVVNNTVSQLNNAIVTSTIQTTSRFAAEGEAGLGVVKRKALFLQLLAGGGIAASYALLAKPLVDLQHSGSLESADGARLLLAMRLSALIVFSYALYAVFIGVLNGRRRFLAQASFDIGYSTLRTVAILAMAALGFGVAGIFSAFAGAAVLICLAAAVVVGPFSGGMSSRLELSTLARAGVGIFGYTLLFNVFLFFDSQMLRPLLGYFAGANLQNLGQFQAQLSGLYGAVQNIGFVPYQLVVAVTFVVFPLVSKATFDNDQEKARGYVETSLRYSLLLLGVLVAAIESAPRALLTLPHGVEYGEVGGSLQRFALGQLCFGLLAVGNTILIGAGQTRRAAEAVVLGLFGFGVAAVLLLPESILSGDTKDILSSLALCSAIGFASALLRTLRALHLLFGGALHLRSIFVVFGGVFLVWLLSVQFPESPQAMGSLFLGMLLRGILGVLCFVAVLVFGRELTREDAMMLLRLVRKKSR